MREQLGLTTKYMGKRKQEAPLLSIVLNCILQPVFDGKFFVWWFALTSEMR